MNQLKLLLGAAAAALSLAACGGGGGNASTGAAESQMVRDDRAASASIMGLIAFAKAQIASFTSDTAEPRGISGINLPASDTDEPLPIN